VAVLVPQGALPSLRLYYQLVRLPYKVIL